MAAKLQISPVNKCKCTLLQVEIDNCLLDLGEEKKLASAERDLNQRILVELSHLRGLGEWSNEE